MLEGDLTKKNCWKVGEGKFMSLEQDARANFSLGEEPADLLVYCH